VLLPASSGNFYRRFGTTCRVHLKWSRILKAPEDGTEMLSRTSAGNYRHSPRNNSEERSARPLRGGGLQTRIIQIEFLSPDRALQLATSSVALRREVARLILSVEHGLREH